MKGSAAMIACLLSMALGAFADAPMPTSVSITSQPSGASVVVDGRDRGTTPLRVFDLAPGRHHVKFRLAGYVDSDRFFRTGEEPSVEVGETLAEEMGLLLLRTEPAGCSILIAVSTSSLL